MSFIDNVWPQNDTTAANLENFGGNIIYNIVETLFKDLSFGGVYKKLPNRSIPHISLWISSVYKIEAGLEHLIYKAHGAAGFLWR